MERIKLPGYRKVKDNEVYVRNSESVDHPLLGKVDTIELLKFKRFRYPTKNEVVNLIKESAKKYIEREEDEKLFGETESKIENILRSVQNKDIKKIALGNDKSLRHLKDHYEEGMLQEGRSYIELLSGIVPKDTLGYIRKADVDVGSIAYERAIERMGKDKWSLVVRLDKNSNFPPKEQLKNLLTSGVRNSDVFNFVGSTIDYKIIEKNVKMLSKALTSPGIIERIADNTSGVFDNVASSTLDNAVKCNFTKDMISKESGGLAGALETLLGKIKNKNFKVYEMGKNGEIIEMDIKGYGVELGESIEDYSEDKKKFENPFEDYGRGINLN